MCLLACVAVAGFRFLASSQTGARKARNLYSVPAYTSKTREKRPGDQVAAYAKNVTWVCESPSLRSFFLGREGRILSISPNRRSRDGNFLRFTHGPPRVNRASVQGQLSSFPVFLRQKAWLLIHHGGFRGLEYQVKRKKNLTGLTEKSHGKSCYTVTFFFYEKGISL